MLDAMIAKVDRVRGGIELTPDGIKFNDFAGVQRYARMLIEADLVPLVKSENGDPNKTLARVTACLLLGRRVGIPPEEACQSIYIVNNRATIFGTVPLALCRQHPDWVEAGFQQYFEVDGVRIKGNPTPADFAKDSTRAVCETFRKGASSPLVSVMSIADCKAAGLLGKGDVWNKYAPRMMQARARGYNLQDNFGDALKGLGQRELVDEPEGEPAKTSLTAGSLDLRTLNVSPPIVPPPPAVPLPPPPPPPKAPPVAPPVPPTIVPPASKKRTPLPPPPAATKDKLTASIEELTLFGPEAYMDFLGKHGTTPDDVEGSEGDARAEWDQAIQSEIRRLTLKQSE